MTDTYPILEATEWQVASEEALGSKEKDWLREPGSGTLWLWKVTRDGTGDDWSEKLAERCATVLGIPHAATELAVRAGRRGVLSRDFRRTRDGALVLGNELLWERYAGYPKHQVRRVSHHTVDRVLETLELYFPPAQDAIEIASLSAPEFFVGYLMLDAWIGNQDRHHENWGAVEGDDELLGPIWRLAPSYDHASSLGQNETDARRELRLLTKDRNATLEVWASKAVTPFYAAAGDTRPLSPHDAFQRARVRYPDAGQLWLDRLRAVPQAVVDTAVGRVPEHLMSPLARRFALRLLSINRDRLFALPQP